jgi:DNA polymerase-3 subunit alpha
MAQIEDALKLVARRADPAGANQMGLFGAMAPALRATPRAAVEQWDLKELLRAEKEALGFYVTAHPLDKYADRIGRLTGGVTTADLASAPDGSSVVLVGVVQAVKLKNNKAGKRYATFTLEDLNGAVEVIAWPETYQRVEAVIASDEPVVARGKLDIDEERAQVLLDELKPLAVVMADSVREVHIRAPKERLDEASLQDLKALLGRHGGGCPIYLHLELDPAREAIFLLGNDFRVAPTESFVGEVERMLAPGAVELRAQQGAAI